ncbi:MAG: 50S ribosomal protein L9 [Helicobacteraceae bacterium]|jgi:large subunit ribosomal protein L9|nr:50S ribosomal protein L9 [Helicobacteraceae bacterium]
MKVLLLKEVKNLGRAGEIKEVKDGYGQNFLIAKGYARLATETVIRQFQTEQKARLIAQEQEKTRLGQLAKQLEQAKVTIVKKVGANGSLFGALKKEDVAEALKNSGYEVDKKDIEMSTIKAVGVYEISAKIGMGLHPKFLVEVVSE